MMSDELAAFILDPERLGAGLTNAEIEELKREAQGRRPEGR
jgi:hypothetical protein